jgi:ABC-type branched-subunit amino acid transport system substrate-binding protein
MQNRTQFLAFILMLVGINTFANDKIIGYGYSDAVVAAKNQELFYMGFEVGFNLILGKNASDKYVQVEKSVDGSQMGADRIAKKLLTNKSLVAFVGFPTSHEALIVARIAKQNEMLSITAGSGHSGLANFGNMVYSTGESMGLSVKIMNEFIRKKFSFNRGLVISNPAAVFSINQERVIKDLNENIGSDNLNLEYCSMSEDLKIGDICIENLKSNRYRYIILTSYPDESAKIMDQLDQNKIDLPIITNSSWNTGDIEYIRRYITKRTSAFYSATPWSKNTSAWQSFSKAVYDYYGRLPTNEMGYGYDVGVVIASVIKNIRRPITKQAVIDQFIKMKCFSGTSAGKLCFDTNGGHSDRKIYMLEFKKNRFVEVN